MSSDDRLYRLGLLHLKDKPQELAAALHKIREKYEARRRAKALEQEVSVASGGVRRAVVRRAKHSGSMPAPPDSRTEHGGSTATLAEKVPARYSELLNSPAAVTAPLGLDTMWALKLKASVDTAIRELGVEVLSARPIALFHSSDPNDILFELNTDRGRLQAILSKSGVFTFKWVS